MTALFKKLFAQKFGRPAVPIPAVVVDRASVARERRTTGKLVEDLVECAVEMREAEGSHAARSFLRYAGVAPAVIQRVLSTPGQRRRANGRRSTSVLP